MKKSSILMLMMGFLILPFTGFAQKKQSANTNENQSLWVGTYECEDKRHPLLLMVNQQGNNFNVVFSAVYDETTPFQFEMIGIGQNYGTYYQLNLKGNRWLLMAEDFSMVNITGKLGLDYYKGRVDYEGCGDFSVKRLDCENDPYSCQKANLGVLGQFIRSNVVYINKPIFNKLPIVQDSPAAIVPDPSSMKPVNVEMNANHFKKLITQLSDSVSDKHRLDILSLSVPNHYFSVNQVIKILDEMTFDDQKLQVITMINQRIIDRSEIQLLLESFAFSSTRDKVLKILKNQ